MYFKTSFKDKGVDLVNQNKLILNGERGIRTLDKVAPIQHFQCCAFNHSATSPKKSILTLDHPIFEESYLKKTFTVTIKNKETGKVYQEHVNSDEYILKEFEKNGFKLAFSCRNGCCTSCAVKIISGTLKQPEAMGVSKALKDKGFALLCVAKATSDLEVETTYEDEVYDLQFGQYFGRGNTRVAPPWEFEED